MNPLALGGIVQAVGQIADDLITTDKERLDAELELRRLGIEERKIEADLVRGQLDVNRAEAASEVEEIKGFFDKFGQKLPPELEAQRQEFGKRVEKAPEVWKVVAA